MADRRLYGRAATGSCGVVIGQARTLLAGESPVPELYISAEDVAEEQSRLTHALTLAVDEVAKEIESLMHSEHHEVAAIMEAHKLMLEDEEFIAGIRRLISEQKINAEWAIHQYLNQLRQAFSDVSDDYLKERFQDIWHIGQRLLQKFHRNTSTMMNEQQVAACDSAILVTHDISPAHVIMFWRMGGAGIIVEQGGANAHSMIVARGIGLPMLMGVDFPAFSIRDGDDIILDAERCCFIVHPQASDLAEYRRFMSALGVIAKDLGYFATQPSCSKDGHHMALMANIEFSEELVAVHRCGADGIGLFRTEFMFLRDSQPPDEERQYQQYRDIVEQLNDRPCTFRLLDIGGDKPAMFQRLTGMETEENPALGVRGIRLLLANEDVLRTQLRALLRCSAHGRMQIMIPMVNQPEEVIAVRQCMQQYADELGMSSALPLGCMIETPAAALIADELARVSDFFSIGSNDLIQYTLAADRDSVRCREYYDASHPAIYRLIEMTVRAARQAGIPVAVCGELAGNTEWTETFLNFGVDSLSMATHRVLAVRNLLSRLRYMPVQA